MAATRVGDRFGAERVAFGRYDLLQLVAATRLGGVHRGEPNDASKPSAPLAIKWLKPEHSRDPAIAACFTDVMTRARRLEHAGMCAIVDVDRAPDQSLFVALEWVSGKDWKRIVATMKKQGTTMPPTLVAYVGMRAAQALEAAHRPPPNRQLAPLYHGELSGADILIGYDGRVKLSGLGSAELTAAAQLPQVRTAFRAPELARGAACNAQSDVFSLGACLYQALTLKAGSSQHGSDAEAVEKTSSMIRHIVPAALLEIVRKAVAEEPSARFASAGELASALAHWASTQSSPGDARSLAAFMTSLFEQTRSGPMNDARENTPAQPLRARRLAALTRSPLPEDSVATTPAPVAPVREPRASEAEPVAVPVAAVATTAPALDPAPDPDPDPAPDPDPDPAAASASPSSSASAEESWDSDPWENGHEAQSAWSVAPAAPPVITSRPPAARARARSSQPVAPVARAAATAPAPVAKVAPVAQTVAVQRVAPALPPVVSPGADVFAPLATSSRTAWRVPAFVAASALLVIGAVFALRGPAPAPAPQPALQAAVTKPVAHEPVRPEPAREQIPVAAAPTAAPVTAPAAAARPVAPASAPVATARMPREPAGDAAPREARRPAFVPRATPRSDDANDEPSAAPSAKEEMSEPAAADEPWAAPARPAVATTSEPTPAPAQPAVVEPPAASAPPSAPKASVVRAAEAIAQPTPDFPTRAKRRGVTEGTVTVEYTVDETGAVRDPRVTESQPKGLFDEATLEALARWKYRPKLVDGKPVTSRRSFTFHFQ